MTPFVIVQLVLSIIAAGSEGYARIIEAMHQRAELTDAERDELLKQGEAAFASPRWQPDAPAGGGS